MGAYLKEHLQDHQMKSGLTHAGGWEAGAFSIPSIDGDPVILNIFCIFHIAHLGAQCRLANPRSG